MQIFPNVVERAPAPPENLRPNGGIGGHRVLWGCGGGILVGGTKCEFLNHEHVIIFLNIGPLRHKKDLPQLIVIVPPVLHPRDFLPRAASGFFGLFFRWAVTSCFNRILKTKKS